MKWIFALLFVISSCSFAAESVPAPKRIIPSIGTCSPTSLVLKSGITLQECIVYTKGSGSRDVVSVYDSGSKWNIGYVNTSTGAFVYMGRFDATSVSDSYYCPPEGKPEFTSGPVDLNGVQVCQVLPKVCKMGAIVRIQSDGKETCVANCGAAAGLTNSSQYYFQAGPTAGSTAGEVTCFGQCSIKTIGGGLQLSSGAWTGSYTFTGATCPVVRPEPLLSESETPSGTPAPPTDESTTSPGTTGALDQLTGAASSATGTPVQPTVTGPDGTATLKDVTKTIADSANAQIKAASSQNTATGNLMSNISKDLQNAIIKSGSGGGGGGASASLQAQGNGKLDGIKNTLDQISDKLDEDEGDGPFVPGAGSGAFWESVIPESSFTEIKDKKAESIQKMKDLATEFQTSLQFTELSASGEPDEWTLNMNGTTMSFGMGAFQMILDMGLAAVILLLCALYAVYIVANRK
ncbi:hypothetical protein [Aeromonas salmonicida]|uniref:hypothetical protein n=1 Tax=Aeromonas salmonicida TaxID=645 RepID=UPI000B60AAA7|nr:hypothetical protein [Aeromonas salmonicida]ARW82143.1 hypothetical protein O23A_p1400 [Aeromonas salmonicida]